jgi:signal peptidase II
VKGTALHRNPLRVLYLSASVVVLDQVTKLLVKGFSLPILQIHHAGMELGSSVPLLGNALRLTYIENPGMAFGLQIGSQFALAVLSLAASIAVLYYLLRVRNQSTIVRISMAMILGGAFGNVIDRVLYGVLYGNAPLFYGKVVDFIDVSFLHLSRFGIFNFADAAVTTGVVMLLVFHRALDAEEQPSRGLASSNADAMTTNIDLQQDSAERDSSTDLNRISKY